MDKENNCSLLEGQDYIDYWNTKTYTYGPNIELNSNGDIYKFCDNCVYLHFIKTTDTSIIAKKRYFSIKQDEYLRYVFVKVLNPTQDKLGDYYEFIQVKRPESLELDNERTYYKYANRSDIQTHLEIVEDPRESEILDYFVGIDENDEKEFLDFRSVVGRVNLELYLDKFKKSTIHINNFLGDDKKLFLQLYDTQDSDYHIFDLELNKIEEFEDANAISSLGDDLLLVSFPGHTQKIFNYDYEVVYDLDNIMGFSFNYLVGNTNYIDAYVGGKHVVVTIKNYKELNKIKHKFNDQDLTISFSGELSKLNSVKVNDVELDESNYTKVSGSTIITLKNDYLKTLGTGTYTLKVGYNDGGYASANFEIPEANPQTFDRIMNSILMGSISLIFMTIYGVVYLNKKKRFN